MSDMKLGHLVIRHIIDNVTPFGEHIDNVLTLFKITDLDTEKHLCGPLIIKPVVKFCNRPFAQRLAQTPKASGLFRNTHPK